MLPVAALFRRGSPFRPLPGFPGILPKMLTESIADDPQRSLSIGGHSIEPYPRISDGPVISQKPQTRDDHLHIVTEKRINIP